MCSVYVFSVCVCLDINKCECHLVDNFDLLLPLLCKFWELN